MTNNIVSIPSVLESHNVPVEGVTNTQIDGLKVSHNDQSFIVGKLALNEGNSPHKVINCAPNDTDYQVLLKTALYLTNGLTNNRPISLTTGFPFSTFKMNEKRSVKLIKGIGEIDIDTRPFGGSGNESIIPQIFSVNTMPELIASTLAVRSDSENMHGGLFIVSLGYGTLEIGMSTHSGFIQRTFNSNSGIRYAVKAAMQKLEEEYYLGLRNEHQFDSSFREGHIILQRKRVDLTEIRREAVKEYYRDIVSPLIQNTWTDDDFQKAKTLVLVGGGALYTELVNEFYDEFDGILNIVVPEDPLTMASRGYKIHSEKIIKDNELKSDVIPVGIDIGNANTAICIGGQKSIVDNDMEKQADNGSSKIYADLSSSSERDGEVDD